MNAETMFVMGCAALFDDIWAERVKAEYAAMPEQLDLISPYEVGRLDAMDALELDPTRHGFIRVSQCEEYCVGYRDGNDTLDLIDYIEDVEFWRHGGN